MKPVCPYEAHPCNCKRPEKEGDFGCGDDCLNRLIFTECDPVTCPCGEQCANQKLRKQEWVSGLDIFVTKDRGCGVKSTQKLTAGRFDVLKEEFQCKSIVSM